MRTHAIKTVHRQFDTHKDRQWQIRTFKYTHTHIDTCTDTDTDTDPPPLPPSPFLLHKQNTSTCRNKCLKSNKSKVICSSVLAGAHGAAFLPLNLRRVWKLYCWKLCCCPMPIAAPRSRRAMLRSRRAWPRRSGNIPSGCALAQLALAEFADPPLKFLAGRAATSNGRLGKVTQTGLRGGEERFARANPDPLVFFESENRLHPTRQPMLLSHFLVFF